MVKEMAKGNLYIGKCILTSAKDNKAVITKSHVNKLVNCFPNIIGQGQVTEPHPDV